jgi:hypothetical protein
MIDDLDATLRELLQQKLLLVPDSGLNKDDIQISFNKPDKQFETVNKPTINLFLFDIRENLQLRSNDRSLTRHGNTGTETYAATRIDFTYLISVWAKPDTQADQSAGVTEEHKVLGKVLTTLLRYQNLPKDVLQGVIKNQPRLPRTWVAQSEDTPKTWEFWGGNEWRLKAGISYRVTLHIQPEPVPVDLVTETLIHIDLLTKS